MAINEIKDNWIKTQDEIREAVNLLQKKEEEIRILKIRIKNLYNRFDYQLTTN